MDEVEKLLGEYLVVDGEQKMYILPENVDVEQLLRNFTAIRTEGFIQSQMWRKTDSKYNDKEQNNTIAQMNARLQTMDKRLERLELLLK